MAGQKKVADIYSEVSFKWDKKSLKLLREFKKEIMETRKSMQSLAKMRSGPAQKAAQNAIKSQTSKEKQRNQVAAKNIKLLRTQAKLQKKIAQMPKGQEKATAASMAQRAKQGFEQGRLTGREYDERVMKAEQKASGAVDRADRRTKAAKMAREFREMSRGADLSDRKVQGLRREMRRLNARMVKGEVSNKRYSASMATIRNQMKRTNATARKTGMTFEDVRSNLVALTGAYTAFRGGAEVARIGQQFEKTRVLLGTLFGDKQQEMFAALSSEAERLGLNINQAAGSFAKYSVSAQALGFSNKQMMEQFVDLSESAIVFGLSTEQQLGVFRAFEQIAS